jgi:hypothetical protein
MPSLSRPSRTIECRSVLLMLVLALLLLLVFVFDDTNEASADRWGHRDVGAAEPAPHITPSSSTARAEVPPGRRHRATGL